MATRKGRGGQRRRKSRASVFYTVVVLALMAGIVYLMLTIYGVFAPRASREESVTVLVLNGCGVDGVGQKTARHLREAGFDVVDYRNADSFDYSETIIVDRAGDMGSALSVARHVKTANVIQQIQETPLEDVVVIIGSDYERYID